MSHVVKDEIRTRPELMECLRKGSGLLLLDGGMGTMLGERGWAPPTLPEEMNLDRPDVVRAIHKAYVEAGAAVVETNSFGGSAMKLAHRGLESRAAEINAAAARLAREAAGDGALVAGCAGPLGELLEPLGSLSFEAAADAFRPQFQGLIEGGADFILIETAIDLREVKAAVTALKDLDDSFPFVVSFTFEQKGRTVTGTPPEVAAHWARAVGAVAVGANCGMGPGAYAGTVAALYEHSGLPVFVYANAGLPGDSEQWGPEKYAEASERLLEAGATVIGGCCRTTPAHIAALRERLKGRAVLPRTRPDALPFASRNRLLPGGAGHGLTLAGEGINASRPAIRPHIASGNWSAVRDLARAQDEAGARLLDINVGLPQIDQIAAMKAAVAAVESASDLPLSIDSDRADVMEAGLRACTGIPLLNSVTAKSGEVERGIRLARRYGAVLAVLPLDEEGIPETIEKRAALIARAAEEADRLGYPRSMLVIDGLCMAVGADAGAPGTGLETLRRIRQLGCRTMLGLSNVSHGMPARGVINRTWLAMAMAAGLDIAIANPMDRGIAETAAAGDLLCGHDRDAKKFLSAAASFAAPPSSSRAAPPRPRSSAAAGGEREEKEQTASGGDFGEEPGAWPALRRAIVQGDSAKAGELGRAMDKAGMDPTAVINGGVVPALAEVGKLYDSGRYFLPQLLSAAAAAQKVCDAELARIAETGERAEKGTVVLATVEGDLHDLGKNVVATMLRSHGYRVVDLGKNVACAEIERAAREQNAQVIGLSALMTSTMSRMEENIPALKRALPGIRVIVGGASVSEDYSDRIGADGYSSDAIGAVKLVTRILEK
ncbi:MAG: homocysteine S-methyltransferase family protein [Synergistaceae bacterium]|jgi:5-methyltetrahydrofolate--homocysteine methyltransferase|nr:homocysteine S-methyltransferase family protein [Synergistaceae bacterium]